MGNTEHIRGPTSIYKDHLLHSKISVKDAVLVGKHEAIVVYTNEVKGYTDTMTESIKCGPIVFFPAVNQTLKKISRFFKRETTRWQAFVQANSEDFVNGG